VLMLHVVWVLQVVLLRAQAQNPKTRSKEEQVGVIDGWLAKHIKPFEKDDSSKPKMGGTSHFRVLMCMGKTHLMESPKCVQFVADKCAKKSTRAGLCKKFVTYLEDKCDEEHTMACQQLCEMRNDCATGANTTSTHHSDADIESRRAETKVDEEQKYAASGADEKVKHTKAAAKATHRVDTYDYDDHDSDRLPPAAPAAPARSVPSKAKHGSSVDKYSYDYDGGAAASISSEPLAVAPVSAPASVGGGPSAVKLSLDSDGDGIEDSADAFPFDPKCQTAGQKGCEAHNVTAPALAPNVSAGTTGIDKRLRGLPEQGYNEYEKNKSVIHTDGETHTGDWLSEHIPESKSLAPVIKDLSEADATASICRENPNTMWCRLFLKRHEGLRRRGQEFFGRDSSS